MLMFTGRQESERVLSKVTTRKVQNTGDEPGGFETEILSPIMFFFC